MKRVSFYHRDTGILHPCRLIVTDDSQIALNTPPDHVAIEGHFSEISHWFDLERGEIVERQTEAMVLSPAALNDQTRRKIAAAEAGQGRAIRDAVLGVDASRLAAIEDEIAALRAQLLPE